MMEVSATEFVWNMYSYLPQVELIYDDEHNEKIVLMFDCKCTENEEKIITICNFLQLDYVVNSSNNVVKIYFEEQ